MIEVAVVIEVAVPLEAVTELREMLVAEALMVEVLVAVPVAVAVKLLAVVRLVSVTVPEVVCAEVVDAVAEETEVCVAVPVWDTLVKLMLVVIVLRVALTVCVDVVTVSVRLVSV